MPRADLQSSRADDERLLQMLEARDRGETAGAIGQRYGKSRSAVLGAFYRVDQDLATSERGGAAR